MTPIQTRTVSIPVAEGIAIDAHVAMPGSGRSAVAVVVLGEIWGVNENMRKICGRLAQAGIAAVAPDLYRGTPAPRESDPMALVMRSFAEYPDARGINDCRAVVRWSLASIPGVERIYPWGFCVGGRFAHYLGAVSESVAGVVNFYGRLSFPRQDIKPFLPLDLVELIQVPYLGLFAERDDLIAHTDVAALDAGLAACGTPHFVHIYHGADHAFFNDSRASYHPVVAAQAWDRTLAFLHTGVP
jgi:carboxymethylenebutenolidase